MKKRVYVGLSGGVDSAVSAALLKERGYDVIGVFIKIWQPEFIECTWREDRLDALRVAVHLGIPFREIDLSAEYKDEVVDDMIASYQSGMTPNPDVACNEKIKFGHFLSWALNDGADCIATGHYARRHDTDGGVQLLRGVDSSKDQSYFLYRLTQKELSLALFPVGELQKHEVRAHAQRLGLPVAEKPDSQGLCFVGNVSLKDFLKRFIDLSSGVVVDEHGTHIGNHDGAALFTIGQRHGFETHHMGDTPLYVIAIDVKKNVITVSADKARAQKLHARVAAFHWIGVYDVHDALSFQSRYREHPFSGRIDGNSVSFDEPRLISPGQSLVVYRGEHCLGGGIIRAE